VVALWLLLKAVVPLVKSWQDSAREADLDREAERECLIIRYENAMYLRGDPVGTYAHYTPPTLPLTRPLPVEQLQYSEPRDWYDYDDYDDGLTDWRTT
jgi:hypothetical protein